MIRALAVKGLAITADAGVICALPSAWAAMAVFARPSSQVFHSGVSRLPADRPVVALTFDDGSDPVFTPQIVDVVAAEIATGAR
jgi:peptidoglycan/xylan/chitin deacetylase (PgdA/CDA1 family)